MRRGVRGAAAGPRRRTAPLSREQSWSSGSEDLFLVKPSVRPVETPTPRPARQSAPPVRSKTILARVASCWAVFRRRAHPLSIRCSSAVITSGSFGRVAMNPSHRKPQDRDTRTTVRTALDLRKSVQGCIRGPDRVPHSAPGFPRAARPLRHDRRGQRPPEQWLWLGSGMVAIRGQPEECVAVSVRHNGIAAHIAVNDPAQVLADVAADRRIVARCEQWQQDSRSADPPAVALGIAAEVIVRELAARYARHPNYRTDWRPAPLRTGHDRQP